MKSLLKTLYFWVLVAVVAGVVVGFFFPEFAQTLKPLGDLFISLIKMVIAPLIFCSMALGIAGSGEVKKVGRVGLKALLYFEVVSTFALALGLVIANLLKPGAGFHVNPATLDAAAVSEYASKAQGGSISNFFLHLIPKSFFEPMTSSGDLIQVLVMAILFGIALLGIAPSKRTQLVSVLESLNQVFFRIISMVMTLAPIGVFGSMAFTIGKFGLGSLGPLLGLMGSFYLTCILFIFLVLGGVARVCGFSIFKFLKLIRDEIILVFGTSSSESALAPLMVKLQKMGCSVSVVELVVPTGYFFNLDGTNIYLTLACLFIAQAMDIPLSLGHQLGILLVAMISSKGASGVTGAGFITLAATLSVVPEVPVVGMALILGIDRFMSEARAITNLIGNGVAAVAVSKWEKELDHHKLKSALL